VNGLGHEWQCQQEEPFHVRTPDCQRSFEIPMDRMWICQSQVNGEIMNIFPAPRTLGLLTTFRPGVRSFDPEYQTSGALHRVGDGLAAKQGNPRDNGTISAVRVRACEAKQIKVEHCWSDLYQNGKTNGLWGLFYPHPDRTGSTLSSMAGEWWE
jgi:hypothetical protein